MRQSRRHQPSICNIALGLSFLFLATLGHGGNEKLDQERAPKVKYDACHSNILPYQVHYIRVQPCIWALVSYHTLGYLRYGGSHVHTLSSPSLSTLSHNLAFFGTVLVAIL